MIGGVFESSFWWKSYFFKFLSNPFSTLLFYVNVLYLYASRPTALHDRTRESDEEDVHDRDYDVAALANNLSQAFRYTIYDNDDAEEVNFISFWEVKFG